MAEQFQNDDDDRISSLKNSNYMKTEDFDPKGRVFTIAGFRKDEIKNSDAPATEANVMFFEDEDKAFILKSTTIGQLLDIVGTDSKKACVGKRICIYRDKVNYQGSMKPCMRLRDAGPREAGE
jgi:hypothetical protein